MIVTVVMTKLIKIHVFILSDHPWDERNNTKILQTQSDIIDAVDVVFVSHRLNDSCVPLVKSVLMGWSANSWSLCQTP